MGRAMFILSIVFKKHPNPNGKFGLKTIGDQKERAMG
jgi:hypothetical protein